ncbi:PH domain-containing protein [Streptomyces mobaraensis]|uniref:PH domain-containing protein n=1 Tax=Streptomyces mobaraensis TaxID=35621 RepID=UPI00331C1766
MMKPTGSGPGHAYPYTAGAEAGDEMRQRPAPPGALGAPGQGVRGMGELVFGRTGRNRPSWLRFAVLVAVLAGQLTLAHRAFDATAFRWLLGVAVVVVGGSLFVALRSRTVVGAAGVTVSWGVGRGRTHPWHEIRSVDLCGESGSGDTSSLSIRITLSSGRQRSLPGLRRGPMYPARELEADYRRIAERWELGTEGGTRVSPSRRAGDRLLRAAPAVGLAVLVLAAVATLVVPRH